MRYGVVFEVGLKPKSEPHEVVAAQILAEHFKCNVIFLRRYINKSPDFRIKQKIWELKSPKGNSKRTIDNVLDDARKQSRNIIISLIRSKMTEVQAISKIRHYLDTNRGQVERIIIINKKTFCD